MASIKRVFANHKVLLFPIEQNFTHSNKKICTSARRLSSDNQVRKKRLKTLEDIPGPPNTPFLGNVLGLKNPEKGHDPRYILKSAEHLWEIYGDMWRLDVPGKYPIIWYMY